MRQAERERKFSKKLVMKSIFKNVSDIEFLKLEIENLSTHIENFLSSPYDREVEMFDKFFINNSIEDVVTEILLRTFVVQNTTLTQLVGMVKPTISGLQDTDLIQVTAEIIGVTLVNSTLISGSALPSGVVVINSNVCLGEEALAALEFACYVPPMIEPPLKVASNRECGYHVLKRGLVLNSSHDMPQNYTAINLINGVPLRIDPNILAMDIDLTLEDLPADRFHYPKEIKNHEIAKRTEETFNKRTKELATNLLGVDFYTPHSPDFRGRLYSNGYHIHTQGNDYRRALISLNHVEEISDEIIS